MKTGEKYYDYLLMKETEHDIFWPNYRHYYSYTALSAYSNFAPGSNFKVRDYSEWETQYLYGRIKTFSRVSWRWLFD